MDRPQKQVQVSEEGLKARQEGLQDWQKEYYKYPHKCLRCGHKWRGSIPNPKFCNKCNSPYWNVPPKRKNAKGAHFAGYVPINVPLNKALGLKKLASEKGLITVAPVLREKLKNVPDVSESEYLQFVAQRKAQGLPYVKP